MTDDNDEAGGRREKITRRTITSKRKHVFASNSKFQIERVRK